MACLLRLVLPDLDRRSKSCREGSCHLKSFTKRSFSKCFSWVLLLGAPGIATSSILDTRNKKLLGATGIATRSKDATRGSWPYY